LSPDGTNEPSDGTKFLIGTAQSFHVRFTCIASSAPKVCGQWRDECHTHFPAVEQNLALTDLFSVHGT